MLREPASHHSSGVHLVLPKLRSLHSSACKQGEGAGTGRRAKARPCWQRELCVRLERDVFSHLHRTFTEERLKWYHPIALCTTFHVYINTRVPEARARKITQTKGPQSTTGDKHQVRCVCHH